MDERATARLGSPVPREGVVQIPGVRVQRLGATGVDGVHPVGERIGVGEHRLGLVALAARARESLIPTRGERRLRSRSGLGFDLDDRLQLIPVALGQRLGDVDGALAASA
jgi:acetyl-CoA acetyltransferase